MTVKINGQSVTLYPVLEPAMTVAERAHGFHVTKNNLLAANLTPRQLLNALGQQTSQGAVVDGSIAGLAWYVADMSPTCRRHATMLADYARHGVSIRHKMGSDTPNLYQ